ncbi:unnamed protein product [Rotaria magnacalcarata]|uniref:Uncharacterized protein n=1 Tax=Rotaria magnacalcarata TaxID=392030 RepID=A0A816XFV3_9BILA|nr:unnamed protein product [Rotaria magnacalcarata]
MFGQKTLGLFMLFIVSIGAYPNNQKLCSNNLKINGTNLITSNRKQVLVVGISHLGCQACRNQAVKYNDLYQHAAEFLPGSFYGKIRLFQDNAKDRFVEKLGHHGQRLNNLIFGRCGNLVYTQRYPQSNIEDETNYQQLLRIVMTVSKYKQPCQTPCS